MRTDRLLMALCLAAVAGVTILLVSGCPAGGARIEAGPASATAGGASMPSSQAMTITLPLVFREFDPDYVSPFGVVMYSNVDDARGLQEMKAAGAKWISTMFRWSAVQPDPDTYNWSSWDLKAQNAQAAGMDLFVLFTGNPAWAAALPGGPVTDTQDLVTIVSLMAERYDCDGVDDAPGSPCVHDWSFYAEPDNGDLWRAQHQGKGYWGHNGSGYAAMLAAISPAIHTADPQARVLIGGLAYDWFEPGGPFVRSFLTDTLQALSGYPGGIRAYLDAMAFHYYPLSWSSLRDKALEIQSILANHGVGDLPLVCPEMGYWSSPKWGSSEEGQARWLVQMYVRGLSVGVEPTSWYFVFDCAVPGSPEDGSPDCTCGLLRVDRSFKPAYYAYQTMVRELNMAYYVEPFEPAGIEGYKFATVGGRQVRVGWSQAVTTRVSFPYTHLRLVTLLGEATEIWDNDANDPDPAWGQIGVDFYANQPCYVETE